MMGWELVSRFLALPSREVQFSFVRISVELIRLTWTNVLLVLLLVMQARRSEVHDLA